MAGRWVELFIQPFTATDSIVVAHNLGLEYLNVRVVIGEDARPDLIEKVLVSSSDPTNEFTVDLVSVQSGIVQVIAADTYAVGVSPNTRQYQALTHGQYYTYAENLSATTNATSTLQQQVRITTPSVEEGDYLVNWSFTWNMNQTSRSFVAQIEQDDTTVLWDMQQEPKDGNTAQEHPGAGFAQVTLTAGVHTFDLDFANDGSGNARITFARMSFWRVT